MLCPKLCGSAAIDYVDYMAVHWDIVTGRAGRFLRGRFFCPVYSGKRGVGVRVRCWGETPGPLLLCLGYWLVAMELSCGMRDAGTYVQARSSLNLQQLVLWPLDNGVEIWLEYLDFARRKNDINGGVRRRGGCVRT